MMLRRSHKFPFMNEIVYKYSIVTQSFNHSISGIIRLVPNKKKLVQFTPPKQVGQHHYKTSTNADKLSLRKVIYSQLSICEFSVYKRGVTKELDYFFLIKFAREF